MRQGIIFTTKSSMTALSDMVNDELGETYSIGFKHPTKSKWFLEVEPNGKEFDSISHLLIDYSIVNLTSDWFIEYLD